MDIVPITDDQNYTTEMAKSLWDKAYFVNFIDAKVLVDYGCADGAMLGFISRNFPDFILIGYDNDEKMLKRARDRNPGVNILYTSNWNDVADRVLAYQKQGERACLVLNSVLHEVHSYLTETENNQVSDEIWGRSGVQFDFIAFRDMMVSEKASRPADPIQVARVRQVFGKLPRGKERLAEWENRWGSLSENWSLTHFFLTYRYEANWDRELKENYLPVAYEDFLASIPNEYMPVYKDHFTLPFLRSEVSKTFNIELSERTHLKIVLKRLDR